MGYTVLGKVKPDPRPDFEYTLKQAAAKALGAGLQSALQVPVGMAAQAAGTAMAPGGAWWSGLVTDQEAGHRENAQNLQEIQAAAGANLTNVQAASADAIRRLITPRRADLLGAQTGLVNAQAADVPLARDTAYMRAGADLLNSLTMNENMRRRLGLEEARISAAFKRAQAKHGGKRVQFDQAYLDKRRREYRDMLDRAPKVLGMNWQALVNKGGYESFSTDQKAFLNQLNSAAMDQLATLRAVYSGKYPLEPRLQAQIDMMSPEDKAAQLQAIAKLVDMTTLKKKVEGGTPVSLLATVAKTKETEARKGKTEQETNESMAREAKLWGEVDTEKDRSRLVRSQAEKNEAQTREYSTEPTITVPSNIPDDFGARPGEVLPRKVFDSLSVLWGRRHPGSVITIQSLLGGGGQQ